MRGVRLLPFLLALGLAGCVAPARDAREPAGGDGRDAGDDAPPGERDAASPADDGPDGSQGQEDAGAELQLDGGGDAALERACTCLQSACTDAGVCACAEGYSGPSCDPPRFAGSG